jgi:hypothetical protein
MLISVTVPPNLMDVSNGRLQSIKPWLKKYSWSVSNPINNYGVNINMEIMFPSQKNTKEKKGI